MTLSPEQSPGSLAAEIPSCPHAVKIGNQRLDLVGIGQFPCLFNIGEFVKGIMDRGLGAAPAPPASLRSEGVDRPWQVIGSVPVVERCLVGRIRHLSPHYKTALWPEGFYDPRNEHDSCGIGFVANIKERKSHHNRARFVILVNPRSAAIYFPRSANILGVFQCRMRKHQTQVVQHLLQGDSIPFAFRFCGKQARVAGLVNIVSLIGVLGVAQRMNEALLRCLGYLPRLIR
jgi:hypothetical protein